LLKEEFINTYTLEINHVFHSRFWNYLTEIRLLCYWVPGVPYFSPERIFLALNKSVAEEIEFAMAVT